MSSQTQFDLEPAYEPYYGSAYEPSTPAYVPPVEYRQTEQGEQYLSLAGMLGPAARDMLLTTLRRIQGDARGFVQREFARNDCPALADLLDWKPAGATPTAEVYQLTLRGDAVPEALRRGSQPELTLRLRLGQSVARVQHVYETVATDQDTIHTPAIREALEQAVTQAINPLLTVAAHQALKQQVRVSPQLRTRADIRTTVTRQMVMQSQTRVAMPL